jgi:hypothetical protein
MMSHAALNGKNWFSRGMIEVQNGNKSGARFAYRAIASSMMMGRHNKTALIAMAVLSDKISRMPE